MCKRVYSYVIHESFLKIIFSLVPVTATFQHLQQMTQGLASREQTHPYATLTPSLIDTGHLKRDGLILKKS